MKKVKVSLFLAPEIAQALKAMVAEGGWRGASAYVSELIKKAPVVSRGPRARRIYERRQSEG